ncbi:TetR family transcriptional regulator [Streptomyces tubbatahanensis]|uniref:TetR family transcriptional regulator n=1 Tax=Streptomyces tubbatahanensis TaxID=2923272 RepID=A0ABY3XR45_9ACTN|nr:TetR family transcriptional regulator [Streptomyces tubbatahanensis]UNS96937.1 TetR family transcriptional regulator [Streptomyces tubbatahanensis]
MSTTPSQRDLQKARTRRALLDAGLALLREQSLSSLGLREITRAVGISPAAFYRHFRDVSDLGVALVEESLGSLHEVIRSGLTEHTEDAERIDHLVGAIAAYVRAHPEHIRFVASERHGGVAAVRTAIAAELDRFAAEVAGLLAEDEVSRGWSAEDLRMLGETYVDNMVMTASAFLEAAQGEGPAPEAVAHTARRQLHLISLGRRHWTASGQTSGA